VVCYNCGSFQATAANLAANVSGMSRAALPMIQMFRSTASIVLRSAWNFECERGGVMVNVPANIDDVSE
jgi:hypothetical protein